MVTGAKTKGSMLDPEQACLQVAATRMSLRTCPVLSPYIVRGSASASPSQHAACGTVPCTLTQ